MAQPTVGRLQSWIAAGLGSAGCGVGAVAGAYPWWGAALVTVVLVLGSRVFDHLERRQMMTAEGSQAQILARVEGLRALNGAGRRSDDDERRRKGT